MIYVVLGYKLHKNEIHPILKKRLDLFIKLYKTGDKVILSGGNPHNNKHTEAFMMSKYIRQNSKITKKNIIIENKSKSTIENIKFSMKILYNENIKIVTIISSSKHLIRIKKIVKDLTERKIKVLYRSSKK
jgi:uncharacterized SAM-binding protein YcdF (DUF218 family)